MRLLDEDYRTLASIAKLRNKSVAELAREFLLEGIRNALDPAEIERMIEEEKQRLLRAAEEMRAVRAPGS
ncbi:DUF6290 family protein [Nocardia amikacinitolerans]|uniref:DUF6290 family protein n=1 Tax=Nocardia amikacinitolerans TaxID=756689 RepID=UPI0020A2C794|nr:hypothetical protein [Nocardia amikacinitolerans]